MNREKRFFFDIKFGTVNYIKFDINIKIDV